MQDLSLTPSSTVSSYHGTTPGTALTQSSPDDLPRTSAEHMKLLTSYSHVSSLSNDNMVSEQVYNMKTDSQDDLSGAQPYRALRSDSVKLSATAMPFTPRTANSLCKTPSHDSSVQSASTGSFTDGYIQGLALNDPFLNQAKHDQSSITAKDNFYTSQLRPAGRGNGAVGQNSVPSAPTVDLRRASRYIQVALVPKSLEIDELSVALSNKNFGSPDLVILTELVTHGMIFLHFTDIRDARAAFAELRQLYPCWRFDFISKNRFIDVHRPGQSAYLDDTEARVIAKAVCDGPREAFDVRQVANMVQEFLISFGELLSWKVTSTEFPELEIQVEYYDTKAARDAVRANAFKQAGVTLGLSPPYDVKAGRQNSAEAMTPRVNPNGCANLVNGVAPSLSCPSMYANYMDDNQPSGGFAIQPRPARSISLPSHADNYDLSSLMSTDLLAVQLNPNSMTRSQEFQESMSRGGGMIGCTSRSLGPKFRKQSDALGGHHNVVDIDRIRQGLDVRTTVMLRNIPNKITQAMLKEILDETSRGKYDFMYLRIDFANNCNVGYAFINFEDPWHIIDFVKARAGRRWNCFNSDKVAEVSYATIQGKDCLIQKFRNSSVMMEHPTFRPKIFRTGVGPDGGQEEKFPGPDNTSKMRRSVENAEHVGLFAPRGVHQNRDEQRRRRSQYDRGTYHAEMEATDVTPSNMIRMPASDMSYRPPYMSIKRTHLDGYPGSFDQ